MARPPALTTEVGYINPAIPADPMYPGTSHYWWWELTEQVPELRWPLSLIVYSRMPREDARVWSLLSAIKLPIRRTQFWIDPNGAEDRVVAHVAADLGLPIKTDNGGDKPTTGRLRDRFSFKEHLNEALSCLRYGHSVFEQVYRYDDTSGPFGGKFRLRKLAPRPQFTIQRFDIARHGGLVSITQDDVATINNPTPRQPVIIPNSRLEDSKQERGEALRSRCPCCGVRTERAGHTACGQLRRSS